VRPLRPDATCWLSKSHSAIEHAERLEKDQQERLLRLEELQHKALRDAEIGAKYVTLAFTSSHAVLQPPFGPLPLR
jgi:hypothetical protein